MLIYECNFKHCLYLYKWYGNIFFYGCSTLKGINLNNYGDFSNATC